MAINLRADRSLKRDAKLEPLTAAGLTACAVERGSCEGNLVGYQILCASCQEDEKEAIYYKYNHKNAFSIGLEHSNDLRLEVEDSPIWKHCQLDNGGSIKQLILKL